jgi:hypothetical protein
MSLYAEDNGLYVVQLQKGYVSKYPITVPGVNINNTQDTSSTNVATAYTINFNGSPGFIFRRNNGSLGFNDFRNIGVTGAPAINSLIAPNGNDYADWTFDGTNTELESSTGDLNLRPNLNGTVDFTGNVAIWSLNHTPKLRIGNKGFTQALDIYHDGTNANLSATAGQINFNSGVSLAASTALTAGGAEGIRLGSGTTSPRIYFGSGAPTVTAPQGSLYLRSDGNSTSTRMYINTTGSTTWTAVTTAA